MTIAELEGHAKACDSLSATVAIAPGSALAKALDRALAVEVFSALLTRTIQKCSDAEGRFDMRDVAAHVLEEMEQHGSR